MIVISSKSDKFFERHLPWSVFRSVPIRSVKSHHSFAVTSPSNHRPSGLHLTIRKPLKLRDFWDVSMSFSWVYYKTKGYKKKASCRNGTRLLSFAIFRSARRSNQLVIPTLIDVVTEQMCIIPTRQIQVYEEVFLLNLQVKYSQIC